ncbi:hypothetical protein BH708_06450 [Brachybacterium sp. P6-10-X1]|uniref:hypothetical protein n=1 Tax=Brachybacterium sp. P6-10-X1 TaxID=1903186 RepID=UPI000971AEE8|nr:hypothetical protein [Brachybacterium sp. P6-10-X1]APX32422.1 hypothetical protein BH708_06450 [Brachybacterium sp. P6-10-X1]
MPTDAHSTGPTASRVAGSGPDGAPGPRIRPTVAALLGVETLLLAAAATGCFVLVAGGGLNGRFGTGLGIFLLIFAAGTALAARSILVAGRFGLGYGITWQLFQALVGASLLRGGLYWQGGLALGLAIVLFVLLLNLVRSTPLPGGDD